MLEKYNKYIQKILQIVPYHLKDDCYQAACIGMMKAFDKKANVNKNFDGYVYSCMYSEVIDELARLLYPISLDKKTFLLMHKYRKWLDGDSDDEPNLSEKRKRNLEDLLGLRKKVPLERI